MGSPIDARLSPTATNKLAEERPFAWFQRAMIYTVPPPYPGVLRRVYPGFVQLYSFISMNVERTRSAHQRYFDDLVKRRRRLRRQAPRVLRRVPVGAGPDRGVLPADRRRGVPALPAAQGRADPPRPAGATWRRSPTSALMTVEGENDDISGVGQTQAAHGLCAEPARRRCTSSMSSRASATTASSTAAASRTRSIPRIRAFIERAEAAVVRVGAPSAPRTSPRPSS